jgi:hypothetical protein
MDDENAYIGRLFSFAAALIDFRLFSLFAMLTTVPTRLAMTRVG